MPTRSAKSRGDRFPEVVLTPQEMAEADRATIAAGTPGIVLMERAGAAVAAVARRLWKGGPIAVVAGPGNNGGDGFVAARILRDAGFQVTVHLLGERERLTGDAAEAASRFRGDVRPAQAPAAPQHYITDPMELAAAARASRPFGRPGLVIDALFGAGVRLPLSPEAAALVRAINSAGAWVLAVDLPTGVDGATGAIAGEAVRADATVTFHRLKPGHLLLPGRTLAGSVTLADIGISGPLHRGADTIYRAVSWGRVVSEQVANAGADRARSSGPSTFANRPGLWWRLLPAPAAEGHKYIRGHTVVVSGPASATGAARLAARAALRSGAGLVTVASPPAAILVNAGHLTAIMVREFDSPDGLAVLLGEKRVTAAVIGPGLGIGINEAAAIEAAIAADVPLVLDADALSGFAVDPERLSGLLRTRRYPVVLTPHDGEFARIFPDLSGSRLDRARAAAARTGGTVVLKGADTVVATPGGRVAIADNAPPTLATAGSGDVLAGIIGGLLAQGMPAFEAASAAVWLHGEAARAFGPGLIAEDLPDALPDVLRALEDELPR